MNEMIDLTGLSFSSYESLSLQQRYRLVEIAHDAKPEIRDWALDTLRRASVNPIHVGIKND